LLDGNTYRQQLNQSLENFYKDRIEFNLIFNKKGKYKIQLFGNNNGESTMPSILDYVVNVEKDAKKQLSFPTTYSLTKNINLIEPLYDNLKSGEKVKFKIESDLETIIIIDGQWHYLNKNPKGIFEDEITIQSKPGSNVVVGMKNKSGSCEYMLSYKVI